METVSSFSVLHVPAHPLLHASNCGRIASVFTPFFFSHVELQDVRCLFVQTILSLRTMMQKRGGSVSSSAECTSDSDSESSEERVIAWTTAKIFLTAFLFRALLVCYGPVHDYLFDVNFTDVDYKVFTDAAAYVRRGRSPYERATYRYTPLLAWLLVPNTVWPEFGKMMFCVLDVAVGYVCYEMATTLLLARMSSKRTHSQITRKAKQAIVMFWLANPLTAIISARGNADVVVCAAVVYTLRLLLNNQWLLAAMVHGLIAVQLKIYPLIYLPSIFLYISNVRIATGYLDYCRKFLLNWKGFVFVLVSLISFALSVLVYFLLYGNRYLHESLLYHISRTDTRHNFSPYFYSFYLLDGEATFSQLIGRIAFGPQAALIFFISIRFYDDLPFCWMLITMVFIAFNKVCTSQYFVWFICLLPIAQRSIEMSLKRSVVLSSMWIIAQATWLLPAYFLEFWGVDSFLFIWLASLLFFSTNVFLVVQLITHYRDPFQSSRKQKGVVMVFYLIGLGLGDAEDITVKGLNTVKKCVRVYLEAYTSILSCALDKSKLEHFYGKEVIMADRELVEQRSDELLAGAEVSDVCMLVVGDPFGATTHSSLMLRARDLGIPVKVIHNASIINAVACCGLQLYSFGETVSIVMWTDSWQPDSYYDKIAANRSRGLHTLCLLDIKVKEQSVDNLLRGREIYEPPRYMSCSEAAKQLLQIAERKEKAGVQPAYSAETLCVGLARIGWKNQKIVSCSLSEMVLMDMGEPLHSLVIVGDMHPIEMDMLKAFSTCSHS
uniref:GPI alpha-1,4-mannosyltransferase I, catalytic subunit n=2 Tax=Ascaris TaxID=6251 RepID=A0A9J2PJG0_ASCLU